jgi:Na+/H+ antiporter NhaD/arsenite permease-like protein
VAVKISAVLLLLIIVVLLIRRSGLKPGHAIACTLLGFYLASSSWAPQISDLTNNVAQTISNIKF